MMSFDMPLSHANRREMSMEAGIWGFQKYPEMADTIAKGNLV
jgi:hypothetical protein